MAPRRRLTAGKLCNGRSENGRINVGDPKCARLHNLQRHAWRMDVRSAVGKAVSQGDQGLDRIGKSVGGGCERGKEATFPRPIDEIAQRATRGAAVAVEAMFRER